MSREILDCLAIPACKDHLDHLDSHMWYILYDITMAFLMCIFHAVRSRLRHQPVILQQVTMTKDQQLPALQYVFKLYVSTPQCHNEAMCVLSGRTWCPRSSRSTGKIWPSGKYQLNSSCGSSMPGLEVCEFECFSLLRHRGRLDKMVLREYPETEAHR